MKYSCDTNLKNVIIQINSKLSEIEVKGNSVELLFASRVMLKELFENIKEIEEEEGNVV